MLNMVCFRPAAVVLVTFGCTLLPFSAQGSDSSDFFEMKARPILAKNCCGCHPDTARGGFRVDSREAAMRGGNSGPVIVPGKPDESILIKAVRYTDERRKMPPAGKLRDEQVATLVEWVSGGAIWPEAPANFFTSKVQPIFAQNCYACHTNARLGGLQLDSREAAMKGGKDGPVIVPGKPDESLLIQAVRRTHERIKMPPSSKLNDADVRLDAHGLGTERDAQLAAGTRLLLLPTSERLRRPRRGRRASSCFRAGPATIKQPHAQGWHAFYRSLTRREHDSFATNAAPSFPGKTSPAS
jgi:mono/diheme cytochrome c family protein